MAQLDASIILGGHGVNALGAIDAGNQAAARYNDMQHQTGLRNMLAQNGAGILAGEQGAMDMLAGYDPQMALNLQNTRLGMDATRQGMAQADQRMEIMSAQERRSAEEYVRGLSAEARAAEAKQLEDAVKMGLMIPDAAAWDQTMGQMAPDLVGQFGNRQALAAKYMGMADVLKQAFPDQVSPKDRYRTVGGGLVDVYADGGPAPVDLGVGASPTEYGTSPIFGTDAQGNTVILQLGKNGTAAQTQVPAGVTLDLGVRAEEAAAGTARGKAKGEAMVSAPGQMDAANDTLRYIEEVRTHPGLSAGTGASSFFNILPGTSGYDFQNRVKQLASGAFMTAIQDLRGMGALSNAEGQTATAAVARLDAATSEDEFLAALSDYDAIVARGRDRAAGLVDGTGQPSQPAGLPAQIGSKADYDALPSGAEYIAPDGSRRRKP